MRLARPLALLGLALPLVLGLATGHAKEFPKDVAEAKTLKAQGISWTNEEIREYYVRINDGIPAKNDAWKTEGLSAEQRARRAYDIRHEARLTCRAMMSSKLAVIGLQIRDFFKYLNTGGPTFDQLVKAARKKGLSGDTVYEEIISSANRTNATVNRVMGVETKN